MVSHQSFSSDSVGDIKSGLPDFRIPPFTFNRPAEGSSQNQGYNATFATENETVSFDMALKEFGAGLVLVPVIAILEQVAIAKAFSTTFRLKYVLHLE